MNVSLNATLGLNTAFIDSPANLKISMLRKFFPKVIQKKLVNVSMDKSVDKARTKRDSIQNCEMTFWSVVNCSIKDTPNEKANETRSAEKWSMSDSVLGEHSQNNTTYSWENENETIGEEPKELSGTLERIMDEALFQTPDKTQFSTTFMRGEENATLFKTPFLNVVQRKPVANRITFFSPDDTYYCQQDESINNKSSAIVLI